MQKAALLLATLMAAYIFALVQASTLPPAGAPCSVTFAWDYQKSNMTPDLVFKLYGTSNSALPVTNWTLLTTVFGTNLQVVVDVLPGAQFFVLTASNFWGESDPSNVIATPPLPRGDVNLRIRLGP